MKRETKKQAKMHKVMHEYKHGELHSGSKKGPQVKSRKQAIAIGMKEAREAVSGGKEKHKGKHAKMRGY